MRLYVFLAVLTSFLVLPLAALRQQQPTPEPQSAATVSEPTPPAVPDLSAPELRITEGEQTRTLALSRVDIRVALTGFLSQTTLTLTFKNDTDRLLEGELVFPLPEGATVSGYGLDVNGEMVDGVPVEKQKARIAFEKETRKGVDPGLVEHVTGNNFRTRVYPIPAGGSRTVKVQYVADLLTSGSNLVYSLPLRWKQTLPFATIRIEALQNPVKPVLSFGGLDRPLEFEKQGASRHVAERTLEQALFDDTLTVTLPGMASQPQAVVESFTRATSDRPEHFFVISDLPTVRREPQSRFTTPLRRIGLVWDASLSRREADLARETALVERLLKGTAGTVDVDLIVLRNDVEKARTFTIRNGNAAPLLATLRALPYDGGTNLGALNLTKKSRDGNDYDCWLLFTDGLGNVGGERPIIGNDAPVFAVSSDARANHALLRALSRRSGGEYFNLARVSDDEAVSGFRERPLSLLGVAVSDGKAAGVYPENPEPMLGRVLVSGKLLSDSATVTLRYGFAGEKPIAEKKFTIRQADATDSGIVGRFWAQHKVESLSALAEKHHEAMLALGQDFGIVTPDTSLMVLETLAQHVEHDITPPRSRKAMYAAFMERKQNERTAERESESDRLQHMIAVWNERIRWWDRNYAKEALLAKKKRQQEQQLALRARAAQAGRIAGVRAGDFAVRDAPMAPGASGAGGAVGSGGVFGGRLLSAGSVPAGNRNLPGGFGGPGGAGRGEVAAIGGGGAGEGGGNAIGPVSARAGGGGGGGNVAGGAVGGGGGTARGYRTTVGGVSRTGGVAASAASRPQPAPRPAAVPERPAERRSPDIPAHGGMAKAPSSTVSGFGTTPPPVAAPAPVATEGVDELRAKRNGAEKDESAAGETIAIQAWSPDVPYLKALRAASKESKSAYDAYLKQREKYGNSPAFYLDCAEFFLGRKDIPLALRVLTNIAELRLEDPQLLRILAHRLAQIGKRDMAIGLFEKVLTMRAEEPQSYRDLALVLAARADDAVDATLAVADYNRCIKLLHTVVSKPWDRFDGIEEIALMEAGRIIDRARRLPAGAAERLTVPFDPRLVDNLTCDVRILLTWDTDNTDMDLWVTEPGGEKCFYGHNRTVAGGRMSNDFTQGYGPEEYCLRRAPGGRFTIQANYFGSRDQRLLTGGTTVQATVITDWGRPTEKRRHLTLRLTEDKETITVGAVTR